MTIRRAWSARRAFFVARSQPFSSTGWARRILRLKRWRGCIARRSNGDLRRSAATLADPARDVCGIKQHFDFSHTVRGAGLEPCIPHSSITATPRTVSKSDDSHGIRDAKRKRLNPVGETHGLRRFRSPQHTFPAEVKQRVKTSGLEHCIISAGRRLDPTTKADRQNWFPIANRTLVNITK